MLKNPSSTGLRTLLGDKKAGLSSVFWFCSSSVVSGGGGKKKPTKDLESIRTAKMEEAGQGDFPARGCQMCDPAHRDAIRATADSQLGACGNPH